MDSFVGEIRLFPYDRVPPDWARCDGQLMPISQNAGIWSILGTTYGGDGKMTFALPDLGGCVPMHWGQGPGLSARELGEIGGSETAQLSLAQMASHTHALTASAGDGTSTSPIDQQPAAGVGVSMYAAAQSQEVEPLYTGVLIQDGGSQPHNNMQPYLTLSFCISLKGIFPVRD